MASIVVPNRNGCWLIREKLPTGLIVRLEVRLKLGGIYSVCPTSFEISWPDV